MTLVSTFELLVKPIIDDPSQPYARTVVQGYFLTVANTSTLDIALRILFTATTPEITVADAVVFDDVFGTNSPPIPPQNLGGNPNKVYTDVKIPANDTGLVALLPNLTNPDVLKGQKLEIRGYVEIFLIGVDSYDRFSPVSVNLLLTPEHRGTFLPKDINAAQADFDQLAYALPTSTGGSLFTLTDTAPALKG